MPKSAFILIALLLTASDLGITGLITVPAKPIPGKDSMVLLYTGDGGWRITDRGLARDLADHGIPVVAINSLHYFWTRRTYQETANDCARVLMHYRSVWKKNRVIVVGYSFGADVLPFVLNRLPKTLQPQIQLVALLSPTGSADFEFHLYQWFSRRKPEHSKSVLPELEKLKGTKIVAFCGSLDAEAYCRHIPAGIAKVVMLHSGHQLDKSYPAIAKDILREIGDQ
jgi:type IV secretory pathway VirJ component